MGKKIYKLTLEEIANERGVTIHAVYQAIKRGQLDMKDLRSICKYIRNKKGE